MKVTFEQLLGLAYATHAWDIIECWDRAAFDEYISEFGPMTKERAKELCRFTKAVIDEELAAAKFFKGRD